MDLLRDQHSRWRRGAADFRLAGFGVAAGLAALLGACANTGPGDALQQLTRVDHGDPYIGMSKAEVLKCAGEPRSRIPAGPTTETLVYHYNGAGPVPGGGGGGGDDKKKKAGMFDTGSKSSGANCTASLTFEKGTLVRVSYAHKDVRSPYEWQGEDDPEKAEQMRKEGVPSCVFSLPRCPR
ncbi:MAG: hypothetical protein ACRECX_04330 [Methyloceanibacter sp.]|uniref:hypothetical protein n=1 Tax=Methyloceanibacter sp. TaxID=1965321 RepID=UPI003D6CC1B8